MTAGAASSKVRAALKRAGAALKALTVGATISVLLGVAVTEISPAPETIAIPAIPELPARPGTAQVAEADTLSHHR